MFKTRLGRGAGITWQRCDAIDYYISILTQALGEVDVERIVRRREDEKTRRRWWLESGRMVAGKWKDGGEETGT
jgi:hypothetical protein